MMPHHWNAGTLRGIWFCPSKRRTPLPVTPDIANWNCLYKLWLVRRCKETLVGNRTADVTLSWKTQQSIVRAPANVRSTFTICKKWIVIERFFLLPEGHPTAPLDACRPYCVSGLFTLGMVICERLHNARHSTVTSTLNITFFKTSGLCIYFMYGHKVSTTELHTLIIFIFVLWFKKILVSLFDEMAKNFYAKK